MARTGNKERLNLREAASYLGISKSSMSRLASTGAIPTIRMGERMVRFDVADLDRYLERCRSGGPTSSATMDAGNDTDSMTFD